MNRRLLTRLLVLLAGGAIINIAVAWGCARWSENRSYEEMTPRIFEDGVVPSSQDQEYLQSKRWVPSSGYCVIPSDQVHAFGVERIAFFELPGRSFNWSGQMEPFLIRTRAGWPCHSCQGSQWLLGVMRGRPPLSPIASRFDRAFGVECETVLMDVVTVSERRAIPYGPLWPGFAINTVFHAVILWLLLVAPLALRRRRRIKRGLCPKCAYDLRGRQQQCGGCPECGTPIALKAT